MSIKRVLLPVNKQDDFAQMADFAFAIAEQHQAQVQGMFPQNTPWIDKWMDNWGLPEAEIRELEAQAKQNAFESERLAGAAFSAHANRYQNVDSTFASTFDRSVQSLLDYAIYADIAVLGNLTHSKNTYWRHLVSQMLAQSTKPVFLAPSRPAEKDLGHRIVIAWNQSPEASRAIAAAIPFIERASQVVIATVGPKGNRPSLKRMRDFIALHAEDVAVEVIDPKGQRTGHVLIDKTAETAGSILVMGAYSHHRWREQVFGGVTEFVLRSTEVPALMMH
ncbi:MAG: universal stress protein [Pseudomonadota bacterium]